MNCSEKVDIGVLAKMRDLLPYLDDPLPVPAVDIRLFVETSYTSSPMARTVCLPRKSRSALRNFIIEVSYLSSAIVPSITFLKKKCIQIKNSRLLIGAPRAIRKPTVIKLRNFQ